MNIEKIIYILDYSAKTKKKEIDKKMEFISRKFDDLIINSNVIIDSIKKFNKFFKEIQDYLNGYLFIISNFSRKKSK